MYLKGCFSYQAANRRETDRIKRSCLKNNFEIHTGFTEVWFCYKMSVFDELRL